LDESANVPVARPSAEANALNMSEVSSKVSESGQVASEGVTPVSGVWGRVASATRQWVGFGARERTCVFGIAVFILLWTIELYVVQAITLVYPNVTGERFAFWAPKIRLTLDFLFISVLTCFLPRRWLSVLVVGAFFSYLGLITYFKYFSRPLSLLTIIGNWREGMQVGGFALDMFPKGAALLLMLALAIKLAALFYSSKASLPRMGAWLGGALLTLAYASLFLFTTFVNPLNSILTTQGVGRLGAIRGYLGPWFAEWYYLSDGRVLDRAMARRKIPYDRLTPIEADIPIHKHLVILQAESFDTNILGYKVNGVEITPFLNQLRRVSMFYRVLAMHSNGSSDADFVALNGVAGSPHENTYVIPEYPYINTTPQLLARCGFSTYSFHGNSGEFYRRRPAYEQMGFAGLNFRRELEGLYGLKADRWGVRDKDVLDLSAKLLREASSPTCHFVITLTTHTPYTLLAPDEKEIFPQAGTSVENYINNMRYLDNCLRDYITSLGSGTTVMIYADHPTEVADEQFTPDRSAGREFIPCFIYDTDQNLRNLQKTRRNPAATDGTWNLVDVVNYLRAQIKRTGQPAPPPDAD
jgi:hypothetical protein